MSLFNTNTFFRVKMPGKDRRANWSIQYNNGVGWKTLDHEVLTSINESFSKGRFTHDECKLRVEELKSQLYKERNGLKPFESMLPGNVAIVASYLEEVYPNKRKARIKATSYHNEELAFSRVVKDLGHIPIDGADDPIQDHFDNMYASHPEKHRKRLAYVNRLRNWLNLSNVLHLRAEAKGVEYISEVQLRSILPRIENEHTRNLVAFLFYSGLRVGEAFSVEASQLHLKPYPFLHVTSQMMPDGTFAPTKTRAKRKAFIIPSGMEYITKWLAYSVEERSSIRQTKHGARLQKAAIDVCPTLRLHDLRHSYCVHLIGVGCTLDWVAKSAGHGKEVCERHYSNHVLTDDSVTLMGRLLSSTPEV